MRFNQPGLTALYTSEGPVLSKWFVGHGDHTELGDGRSTLYRILVSYCIVFLYTSVYYSCILLHGSIVFLCIIV